MDLVYAHVEKRHLAEVESLSHVAKRTDCRSPFLLSFHYRASGNQTQVARLESKHFNHEPFCWLLNGSFWPISKRTKKD